VLNGKDKAQCYGATAGGSGIKRGVGTSAASA
jgi:hypothetical protein